MERGMWNRSIQIKPTNNLQLIFKQLLLIKQYQ